MCFEILTEVSEVSARQYYNLTSYIPFKDQYISSFAVIIIIILF